MKTFKYISSGLIIGIIVMISGCKSAPNEMVLYEMAAPEATDAVVSDSTYEFESDSVSEESLRAFEQRAIQKLNDVADYFEILSNKSMDASFRKQAKQMMREVFVNPESRISFYTLPDNQIVDFTIAQFADSLLANQYSNLKLEIANALIDQPLQLTKELIYEGKLSFDLKTAQNNRKLTPQPMEARIFLIKKKKTFGSTSKEVWEVFLGDVKNKSN